jgi:predicted MFS family arabinose efflux permease
MNTVSPRRKAEILAIALLCPIVGLMTFGLAGSSYLMPFIKPDLGISNAQIGLLTSGTSVAFAASGAWLGAALGRLGRPKLVLVVLAVLFGLSSVLPGLTSNFTMFLLARMLMSAVEGPIMPTAQTLIALESPPERRGLNMGIVHTLGNGLFMMFAPVLLVSIAEQHGWHAGYFVIIGPALLFAWLASKYLREPNAAEARLHDHTAAIPLAAHSMSQVLATRNVWLCATGAACVIANLIISSVFLPFYLTQVKGVTNQSMGWLMTMAGLASIILGVVFPGLSDRIGRRPAMLIACALSGVCPLVLLGTDPSAGVMALILFLGWALTGASVLFVATVPSESVPADQMATAIGLVNAISVLVGGIAAPALAGMSADRWGFAAPVLMQAACAGLAGAVTLLLAETAPVTKRSLPSAELRPSQGLR